MYMHMLNIYILGYVHTRIFGYARNCAGPDRGRNYLSLLRNGLKPIFAVNAGKKRDFRWQCVRRRYDEGIVGKMNRPRHFFAELFGKGGTKNKKKLFFI